MIADKCCPYTSGPVRTDIGCTNYVNEIVYAPCVKEKCAAWSSETSVGYCRLIGVKG
jgi:hypothetical protein